MARGALQIYIRTLEQKTSIDKKFPLYFQGPPKSTSVNTFS